MKKKITNRQKDIIVILASSPENKPITMSKIANLLSLSTRTVLREMDIIENWLTENDFKFVKKPGVGLILNESEENKRFLLELIDQEKIEKSYTENERKLIILAKLFSSSEPIKAIYFIKTLKISDNILNQDFNNVSSWLLNFNISLIRKPGIGAFLKYDEKYFRSAYVSLIYEYYGEKDFLKILQNINENIIYIKNVGNLIDKKMIKLLDEEILSQVMKILERNIQQNNINLSDNAYIELLFHISLAIKRIKTNQNITMTTEYLKEVSLMSQFELAKKIASSLEEVFKVIMTDSEIGFITIHLRASKLRITEENKDFIINDIEFLNIAKKLIKLVEEDLKIFLVEDERFLKDLINHLVPSICRIDVGMKIRNPFLNEVKTEYIEIYLSVYKNIEFIKEIFNIAIIPEEEIAYIAMHFVAAIERALMKININIVISCPTGIGTSSVLKQKLKEKFYNLNILETISSLKIDENYLKNKNIDLIISTVELKTLLPHICVTPLLTFEDEKIIKKIVLSIASEKISEKNKSIASSEKINVYYGKELLEIMEIGKGTIEFLEEFELLEELELSNLEELIDFSCKLFVENELMVKKLYKDLKNRLSIHFPFFEEIDILLLHCATDTVNSMKISVIRLKNPIKYEGKLIKYTLFMLLPKNAKMYEQQILSEISSSLLKDISFINNIKFTNKDKILNNLKNIILKYYYSKIKQLNL